MERHTVRALLSIGTVVLLAFAGIALFEKRHASGGFIVLVIVWAVLILGVLASALWSVAEARQARVERRPEGSRTGLPPRNTR